ncbi:MAG: PDZ domain-containing protein [Aureliella sp.]
MARTIVSALCYGCLVSCLSGVLSLAGIPQARAQEAVDSEQLLQQEQEAFAAAAKEVAPCVVQIETFGGQERIGQELVSEGPTTGTIVGEDGWIISSMFSFRQQPASILVSLPDGTRVPARIVARDHSRELALLKVEAKSKLPEPKPCPLDEVSVGQWAIGLGRTFERDSVSQSVGIISALGRAYGKAIQTDAKVSPVNYGGPLIDLQGRVIGILAPISPGAILEGDTSQLYDSGIGFAIPLVDILERLPEMEKGHDIHSGKLGIVVADQNELAGPVKVAGAAPGSPAAKAGLKPGDTIVSAAGHKVQLLAHLRHALGPVDAGSKFEFSVMRNGKTIDLECTLVEKVPTYRLRYLGIEAENLVGGGVRITRVLPSTPAADAKLEAGMRIVGCGNLKIQTTADLRQQISIAELDAPLKLKVLPADAAAKAEDKDGDKDEQKPREIAVKVTTWPTKIEPHADERNQQADAAEVEVEDIELALGDFPNKAWAWCPAAEKSADEKAGEKDQKEIAQDKDKKDSKDEEHEAASGLKAKAQFGLLLLLPEPGEVDRDQLREMWLPLVRQGWCVAVVQSGDKNRWSAEEVELIDRVRSQVADRRPLDPARTVVGGLGVGGRLALIGARASQSKISGVMLIGTPLEGVKVQRENSPSDSLHVLAVGPRDSYRDFLDQLRKFGYPAVDIPVPELVPSKWETLPLEQITDWLHGLGRI